jgi:ATP-binding cassette, subfamily B, bacterial
MPADYRPQDDNVETPCQTDAPARIIRLMPSQPQASRRRYEQYKTELAARRGKSAVDVLGSAHAGSPPPIPVHQSVHRPPTRSRSIWKLLLEFFRLIKGHRLMLVMTLATATVATLIGLAPLYGTKIVFDNVLGNEPLPGFLAQWVPADISRKDLRSVVAVSMISLTVLSLVFSIWGRWHSTRVSKRVQVGTRRKVFDHAVRLPLNRVYDLKAGGVASILREDAGGVGELVFSMVYNPWKAVIQLIGSLAILAWVDWRLLLGALLLLPTVWLTHRTWISRIRPLYRDIRASRQHIDAHATESFGGMRVVRSFGRQRSEAGQFTRNNHMMIRQELHAWWWTRAVDIVWSILIPTATAAVLWYGSGRILDGTMTAGELVLFIAYLGNMLGPLAMLANTATALQNQLAGLDRILDLLNEPIEMPLKPGLVSIRPEETRGRITFRGVSFTYAGGEQPVLRHVNLDVQPGQMIALVGPSGAGKTTFCNLVARFYDPTEGAILLDGTDLRDIDVDSYRRLLGIVEQDTFLFDGTVADNIGYGRRGATMQQIIEAARLANAHGFISQLDHGYDTWIGERGVKLSGGQRQRLTIARAILADPRILILDEATSNLDTESERLIQGSLQTLMAGRTSFVIAHRLSTIAHADRIIVMEDGQIVEQGRHDELLAQSGRYREMVELQTRPPTPAMEEEAPQPVG